MRPILLPAVAAGLLLAAGVPTTSQAQPAKTSASITTVVTKQAAFAPLVALFAVHWEE